MAKRKEPITTNKPKRAPSMTPEARENLIISRAYDLAEQQIMAGTASSQVITHFLKLGTQMHKLELESQRQKIDNTKAKTETLRAAQASASQYEDALRAMRKYSGQSASIDEEE